MHEYYEDALIACTATHIKKATPTTSRPLRVHLPEPPKALKLRYAFLILYAFTHYTRNTLH